MYLLFTYTQAETYEEQFQYLKTIKLKISLGRKTPACCFVSSHDQFMLQFGGAVTFCGFISCLIGHETMNISDIFSGVNSFMGKTVSF